MSFRRELVSGFDQRLLPYWSRFEDDVIVRIYHSGYRVRYDPDIRVHHHVAPVQGVETRSQDPQTIYGNQHNNTYVTLKHGNLGRNSAFLVFTFLVGDRVNPGILFYLARGVARGQPVRGVQELFWGLRGKLAGIRTYRRWSAETP
jgi:hypothetical protein